MKTTLALLTTLILTFTAAAQTVTVGLAWDPSPSEGVDRYSIYVREKGTSEWARAGRVWADQLRVWPNGDRGARIALDLSTSHEWEIMVTAGRGGVESAPSNIVDYVAPSPATALRVVDGEGTAGTPAEP